MTRLNQPRCMATSGPMGPAGPAGGASTPQPPSLQIAVLVFLKSLATPIVLYADDPKKLYLEIKEIIKNANPQSPKLVEKPGVGPLKKVCLVDSQIAGVAIQVDPTAGMR